MSFQGAAAGPSGIQKKCLYCTKAERNLDIIIKGKSELKYICEHCADSERFTVAKLAEKIGSVDLMNQIKEMKFFKRIINIREETDVNNVSLGYLELEKCGVCHMEIPRNISAEQHCKDDHSHVFVMHCYFGCGRHFRIGLLNEKDHGSKCGKFCPHEGCKKFYHLFDEHFQNEHRPFFCPIVGCTQGFPPENIEQICSHIDETHLFHLAPQVSPPKKLKTVENQPDVVAGPSGEKDATIIKTKKNGDQINISKERKIVVEIDLVSSDDESEA